MTFTTSNIVYTAYPPDWYNYVTAVTAGSANYAYSTGCQTVVYNWPPTNGYGQTPIYQWPTDGYGYQTSIYQLPTASNSVIFGEYAPETPEERAAREERQFQERLKREAAKERAEQLLLMCLSAEQKKQYLELGYFETLVKDKTYRINKGRSGNVQLIEDGVPKARFCIHTSELLPDPDTMLAQYLMLRTNEEQFLKTANRTILHS